jgi:glucokinase
VILAGDVGGTKATLALFDAGRSVREATLASRDFDSLEAAVAAFLGPAPHPPIAAVAIGIAGPVVDGRATATNLAWSVDERTLGAALGVARARLVNDLEATAHGIFELPDEALVTLQAGGRRRGNVAVIAAGTGLGEALVVDGGGRRIVVASEGGHADFAPRSELEDGLLRFLRREFGHVSWERVVSGPGLVNVYRFLREAGVARESPTVAAALRQEDPAAVITRHALAHSDPLCANATELFVAVYGAEAGNLALKGLAVGGVVVAGGIAPRILPLLRKGTFVAAFRDKGRLARLMDTISVRVALDPRAALLGAARVAAGLLAD